MANAGVKEGSHGGNVKGTLIIARMKYLRSRGTESAERVLKRMSAADQAVLRGMLLPSTWYPADLLLRSRREGHDHPDGHSLRDSGGDLATVGLNWAFRPRPSLDFQVMGELPVYERVVRERGRPQSVRQHPRHDRRRGHTHRHRRDHAPAASRPRRRPIQRRARVRPLRFDHERLPERRNSTPRAGAGCYPDAAVSRRSLRR